MTTSTRRDPLILSYAGLGVAGGAVTGSPDPAAARTPRAEARSA